MVRLPISFALTFLCATGPVQAWQRKNVDSKSWSGIIINSGCTAEEAFAEADKCYEPRGASSRLALYDDTTRQIFDLDAQDKATPHFADSVTVEGTLQGDTIHVTALKKLTAIGLETGRRAPAFSARDQFGSEHTLEALKGPKGTVLLFFRSADW